MTRGEVSCVGMRVVAHFFAALEELDALECVYLFVNAHCSKVTQGCRCMRSRTRFEGMAFFHMLDSDGGGWLVWG